MHEIVKVGQEAFAVGQICPPGENTYVAEMRNTSGAQSLVLSSVTMPFDSPGGACQLGAGQLLVAGLDGATGMGYLCRLQVTGGITPSLAIVETQGLGLFDPERFAYHVAEARIYLLDPDASFIRAASWGQGVALPALWSNVDVSGTVPVLTSVEISNGPEGGVHLFREREDLRSGSFDSHFRVSVYLDATQVWNVVPQWIVPQMSNPIAWTIDNPFSVGYQGPVRVRGEAAGCQLVNLSTGLPEASIGMASVGQWTVMPLLADLQPGEEYQIQGGALAGSVSFWPTFRAGVPSEDSGYAMQLGELKAPQMTVGNQLFGVDSAVRFNWVGQAPATDKINSFLWAKVGVPGPGTTITLPSGHVIIANPEATFGPSGDDTPINITSLKSVMKFNFPLPLDDSLEGVPIIFQFVAIAPGGAPIISDVFGSVIQGGAAAANAALAGGGGASGGGMPLQARCSRCRNWLVTQGMSPAFSNALNTQVLTGLIQN